RTNWKISEEIGHLFAYFSDSFTINVLHGLRFLWFFSGMKTLAVRGALFFTLPVLAVFIFATAYGHATGNPHNYYYLAAGPLCGIAGGLAFGRRFGLPLILGLSFGSIGFMFSLQQETRSGLFSDVVWTGLVSAFLFWLAGGCAMLSLPRRVRFNGAMALAVP